MTGTFLHTEKEYGAKEDIITICLISIFIFTKVGAKQTFLSIFDQ